MRAGRFGNDTAWKNPPKPQLRLEDWIFRAAVGHDPLIWKEVQSLKPWTEVNLVLGIVVFGEWLCVKPLAARIREQRLKLTKIHRLFFLRH